MATIMKNHKNTYHDSTIQYGGLQEKPNTTKFGSIFNLNKLLAIFLLAIMHFSF